MEDFIEIFRRQLYDILRRTYPHIEFNLEEDTIWIKDREFSIHIGYNSILIPSWHNMNGDIDQILKTMYRHEWDLQDPNCDPQKVFDEVVAYVGNRCKGKSDGHG